MISFTALLKDTISEWSVQRGLRITKADVRNLVGRLLNAGIVKKNQGGIHAKHYGTSGA